MISNIKEQKISSYNRLSSWYNAVAGGGEAQLRQAGLRRLEPKIGEDILEIGFGTGHSIIEIAQAVGASGKVYGIDISNRMLEIAQARAIASGFGARIELRLGDALALPYPDRSIDALFMSFALEVFAPTEVGFLLEQCKRVIRPKGRLCVVAMSSKGKHGIMMKLYKWAHVHFPNTVDCRPIDSNELLFAAGFKVIEDEVNPFWGLAVEVVLAMNRVAFGP
jgi:ubiquinone/menaquinone biosynthesis C-methylase UbiE